MRELVLLWRAGVKSLQNDWNEELVVKMEVTPRRKHLQEKGLEFRVIFFTL